MPSSPRRPGRFDAVVVGAGHHGLVAANILADRGWDVIVLEAQAEAGGAVRSDREAGFVRDMFSAFYPLVLASPVLRTMHLEDYGLRWRVPEAALAHVTSDGRSAVLSTDPNETAVSLDSFAPGDGERWLALYEEWRRIGDKVVSVLLDPFPPIRAALPLLAGLGVKDTLRLARRAVLPVRRFGEEEFEGQGGPLLLAGNALHADLSPEAVLSGFFGWLLTCLGQQHGFPVPEGGAGQIVSALQARLLDRGGRVETNAPVARVITSGSRASGVRTEDGRLFEARRAVIADVGAPQLYLDLVDESSLPADFLDDVRRFQYDSATVKVDWSLSGPVPWKADGAHRAGTVHVADSMDALTRYHTDLVTGHAPADPFLVVGQMTASDRTRSPDGTESLWAYTHVPQSRERGGRFSGRWDEAACRTVVERMESKLEANAPGFRDLVESRRILGPDEMEQLDANLVGGAVNGGTAQLHQELIFRPVPGFARAETPVRGLYLGSASAHPGGGVHGAAGANAARAALGRRRLRHSAVLAGAWFGWRLASGGKD